MGSRGATALLVLLSAADMDAMAAPCAPPPPVAAYLKAHPGWRVLTVADLVVDDQLLWRDNHQGLCPGMADVRIDGSAPASYALALIRQRNGKAVEQLVALKATSGEFQDLVLEPQFEGGGVVVWRAPPGKSSDMETGPDILIAHDSIIWEKMESASQQFYFANGKFHKLQTGD